MHLTRTPRPRDDGGLIRAVAALWVALAAACFPAPAIAQDRAAIDKARSEAIRQLDLQTELPQEELGPVEDLSIKLPQEIFWVIIAIGAVAAAVVLADSLPLWRPPHWRRRADEAEDEAALERAAGAAAMLRAADDLAAEGRFAEAMHALLLETLAELRQRVAEPFADSLTSREILRRAPLPEEGRTGLRDLIARVELTHFGDYPAEAADFFACRRSFEAIAKAVGGAAPA